MGYFLLAYSNQIKLYGDKGLKKFQLLLESKRSEGLMLLVICATTVEIFLVYNTAVHFIDDLKNIWR